MQGITDDSGCQKVNGGVTLLEYALSQNESEKYHDTKLYKLQSVKRQNFSGIDFEEWGISDDINKIELRLISGDSSVNDAKETVSIGDKGLEALAADRQKSEVMIAGAQSPDMRQLFTQTFGKSDQLSDLCEQFMRDDGIGENSVPS